MQTLEQQEQLLIKQLEEIRKLKRIEEIKKQRIEKNDLIQQLQKEILKMDEELLLLEDIKNNDYETESETEEESEEETEEETEEEQIERKYKEDKAIAEDYEEMLFSKNCKSSKINEIYKNDIISIDNKSYGKVLRVTAKTIFFKRITGDLIFNYDVKKKDANGKFYIDRSFSYYLYDINNIKMSGLELRLLTKDNYINKIDKSFIDRGCFDWGA